MNRVSEEELKRITEEKGFEYVGVNYTTGKTHNTNIVFICPKHREKGTQSKLLADMRKSNGQCNYCNGKMRTHDDFVELMKSVNENIEFLSEYKQSSLPIQCKCKICGYEWDKQPNALLGGSGCLKCANKLLAKNRLKTHETFISEIEQKFQGKISILSKYTGSHDVIICKCNIDSTVWESTPTSLLSSVEIGCPTCLAKITRERCVKGNKQFLQELSKVNPDIIPLEEYKGDHVKIKCKCKIHDYIWNASPNKILHRRTGCPKCSSYHNENVLDSILDKWGFKYTAQKRFSDCCDKYPLPFDRYLDDFNVLIEYDGEQHFKQIPFNGLSNQKAVQCFEKTQLHDKIKNEYCKNNNIPLIRIPYWERDDMEYYLFDKLVKYKIIEEI